MIDRSIFTQVSLEDDHGVFVPLTVSNLKVCFSALENAMEKVGTIFLDAGQVMANFTWHWAGPRNRVRRHVSRGTAALRMRRALRVRKPRWS